MKDGVIYHYLDCKWIPRTQSEILAAVKGFGVPQLNKERIRPVFEPSTNPFISKELLPSISYHSRLERRHMLFGKKYVLLFDIATFYDHIQLDDSVLGAFIMRVPTPSSFTFTTTHTDGTPCEITTDLFALTRDPMGSASAAHTAQNITYALEEPLVNASQSIDITVCSIIDNVACATEDPRIITWAGQTFTNRCKAASIKLNDSEQHHNADWAKIAHETSKEFTFAGEVFTQHGVRNSTKNVEKIEAALKRVQESPHDITRRQLAALISALFFAASTLNIQMHSHFNLLKVFSENAKTIDWDEKANITPYALDALCSAAGPVLANRPVLPVRYPPPSCDWPTYDAVIICDASAQGWAAIIYTKSSCTVVAEGFKKLMPFSAHSEPIAGAEAIRICKSRKLFNIAVVTDHQPMVSGQRRYWNGHGGFSSSYFLNQFFAELYSDESAPFSNDRFMRHVFFIPGESNPADPYSRNLSLFSPRYECTINHVLPGRFATLSKPDRPKHHH
jgi:hypothetical protein